jgi:hypothetical protein
MLIREGHRPAGCAIRNNQSFAYRPAGACRLLRQTGNIRCICCFTVSDAPAANIDTLPPAYNDHIDVDENASCRF